MKKRNMKKESYRILSPEMIGVEAGASDIGHAVYAVHIPFRDLKAEKLHIFIDAALCHAFA